MFLYAMGAWAQPSAAEVAVLEAGARKDCIAKKPAGCFLLAQILSSSETDERLKEGFALASSSCRRWGSGFCSLAESAIRDGLAGDPVAVWKPSCEQGSRIACEELVRRGHLAFADRACAAGGTHLCTNHRKELGGTHEGGVPAEARKLLTANGLSLTVPTGFVWDPPKQNPHLAYQIGLRAENAAFEVRYHVVPLAEMRAMFEKSKSNPEVSAADPIRMGRMNLQVNALNLSGGQMPSIQQFPPMAVGAEFGADQGFTTAVTLTDGFETERKHAMLVSLQRRDETVVTVVYLFDDPGGVAPWQDAAFHALQFGAPPL